MTDTLPLFRRACVAAFTAMALLSSFASAAAAAAPSQFARPVMVGIDGPDQSACSGQGEVRGLGAEGDQRLSVLSGPHAAAVEIDRLRNGVAIILCDSSRDGKWSGIVYPAPGQVLADCVLAGPVARPTPYRGPCRSGWVASTFVVVTPG